MRSSIIRTFHRRRGFGYATFAVAAAVLSSYAGEARADALACSDYLCPTVTVTESPPKVRLELPATPAVESCTVAKRNGSIPRPAGPTRKYDPVATFTPTSLVYEDTTVKLGDRPEYRLDCRLSSPVRSHILRVVVGVRAQDREDRGIALLLVDSTKAAALAPELERLENDLADDGWGSARLLVPPTDTPPMVRARIAAYSGAFGPRLRSVLLLGAIPRVFSGFQAYDGHLDHDGAWPADAYYGDVDGNYTDTGSYAVGTPRFNGPGDGKFDQTDILSALETMVGRIDTEDMPAFAPLTSTDLVRIYLDKNHRYRTGQVSLGKRVWLTNTFGGSVAQFEVYPPAHHASVLTYGVAATEGADFLGAMADPAGYAMAFGAGPGGPSSAAGVATTSQFVTSTVNAGFLGLFGSYFGDYSYSNNLMRAALVGPGSVVATTWFARPNLDTKELSARGTLGDMISSMFEDDSSRTLHLGLLGDPTLRLEPMRPPSAPVVTCKAGKPNLAWTASPDATLGYRIFRKETGTLATTPDVRVSGESESGPFVDASAAPGQGYVYRIVPVRAMRNGSGSFVDLGPGARVTTPGCAPEPPPAPTGSGSGTGNPPPSPTSTPTGGPSGSSAPIPAPSGTSSSASPSEAPASSEVEEGCQVTTGGSRATSLVPACVALLALGALGRRRAKRVSEVASREP